MARQQKPSMTVMIRQAIQESKVSRRELCRQANIDPGNLSKFMSGSRGGSRGMTIRSLEKLAPLLGLRLVKDAPEG